MNKKMLVKHAKAFLAYFLCTVLFAALGWMNVDVAGWGRMQLILSVSIMGFIILRFCHLLFQEIVKLTRNWTEDGRRYANQAAKKGENGEASVTAWSIVLLWVVAGAASAVLGAGSNLLASWIWTESLLISIRTYPGFFAGIVYAAIEIRLFCWEYNRGGDDGGGGDRQEDPDPKPTNRIPNPTPTLVPDISRN